MMMRMGAIRLCDRTAFPVSESDLTTPGSSVVMMQLNRLVLAEQGVTFPR